MEAKQKKRRFKARGGSNKKPRKESSNGSGSAPSTERDRNVRGNESFTGRRPAPLLSLSGNEATTLDRDLFAYLARIQDELNSLIEDDRPNGSMEVGDDDADPDTVPPNVLLAQNALSEITPRLHEVAMDPSGSRVLENLLRNARDADIILEAFRSMASLGANRVLVLSQHRCASHVIQGMLNAVASLPISPMLSDSMKKFVEVLRSWDADALLSAMDEMSSSHVVRSIFAVLAGISFDEPREAKIDDSSPVPILPYFEISKKDTPEEWHGGIRHCAELLLESNADNVLKLPWTTGPCSALQSIIAACAVFDRGLAKKLVKHVLGDQLSDLVYDRCGSRFVERAIACLGAGIVLDKVKGHLSEMIDDPKANFVVQRVFLGLKGRAQVKAAWDEVEEKVEKMIKFRSSREGVVLAMLRSAEAEGGEAMQRRAGKCVAKAFGATGNNAKHLIGAVLAGSLEGWTKWKERILKIGEGDDVYTSPMGVAGFKTINMLMARCLLRYPGPAGQISRDSMATFTSKELLAISGDAVSSRLLEQWFDIEPKNCAKFIEAILLDSPRSVIGAATSAYGTQILSKSIPYAPRELQTKVMEVLASKVADLKSDRFGAVVVRKCRVEVFAHNKDAWYNAEASRATRMRMFADILNDTHGAPEKDEGPVKKEKKKKKRKEKKSSL